MEASFWHQRWERGELGFHQSQVNSLLMANFKTLNLLTQSRVFVPLCGKTLDIAWLLAQGYRVVGVELSELAIKDLFKQLGLAPEVSMIGSLTHYQAKDIDIFVGDIFDLSAQLLGPVDAIYDRAALVALPTDTRAQYVSHLIELSNAAPQLLICFEYDQQLMNGPPFSVDEDELKRLFSNTYSLKSAERKNVEGGLKGIVAAMESAWILRKIS